jgi:hypothetical protein
VICSSPRRNGTKEDMGRPPCYPLAGAIGGSALRCNYNPILEHCLNSRLPCHGISLQSVNFEHLTDWQVPISISICRPRPSSKELETILKFQSCITEDQGSKLPPEQNATRYCLTCKKILGRLFSPLTKLASLITYLPSHSRGDEFPAPKTNGYRFPPPSPLDR